MQATRTIDGIHADIERVTAERDAYRATAADGLAAAGHRHDLAAAIARCTLQVNDLLDELLSARPTP